MKNKFGDLNNYLFVVFECFNDEVLIVEQIESEVKCVDVIVLVVDQIVVNVDFQLKVVKLFVEYGEFIFQMLFKIGRLDG